MQRSRYARNVFPARLISAKDSTETKSGDSWMDNGQLVLADVESTDLGATLMLWRAHFPSASYFIRQAA